MRLASGAGPDSDAFFRRHQARQPARFRQRGPQYFWPGMATNSDPQTGQVLGARFSLRRSASLRANSVDSPIPTPG